MNLHIRKAIASIPARLIHGSPAILLGIILNTLDIVSTGLLVYPSIGGLTYSNLQVQSMSVYLMSTIACQIALTFGGSLFPGAMGSLLIEILPFLRGMATDIQNKLGDDHPNVLPTVMAAYAMASFLIGFTFIALGVLRCGRLVEYFPRTVLHGAIGAIGISLFILALQLTLPPNSDTLSLSSANHLLFNSTHLPLLAASVLPPLFLSVSTRIPSLSRATRGCTEHALYVPTYIIVIAGMFWAIAAGMGLATPEGMEKLSATGWLFTVEESVRHQKGLGRAWDYWSLFDFKRVEWYALTAAVQNIVLLVVIGVLNLPIYIPAMALSLDMASYNMNHELIGHGLANILAGIAGTAPNLVVLSNTRLFTLAGGGRFEGGVLVLFTIVLFFTASFILPYVPTIVASTFILYLCLELLAETLWHTLESLIWCEYAVVLGTLLSCTFIGFAPGFGVGIGMAVMLHFAWGVVDTPVRSCHTKNVRLPPRGSDKYPDDVALTSRTNTLNEKSSLEGEGDYSITVVQLTGYVFFANIPSLERKLKPPAESKKCHSLVIDLSKAHRIETSVVQFLERKAREYSKSLPTDMVLAGVRVGSGISGDLHRGGIECRWTDSDSGNGIMTFADVKDATEWIKHSIGDINISDQDIIGELRRMVFGDSKLHLRASDCPMLASTQLIQEMGVIVRRPNIGDLVVSEDKPLSSIFLVLRGRLAVGCGNPTPAETTGASRPSVKKTVLEIPKRLVSRSKTVLGRRNFRQPQVVDEESLSFITIAERRQLNPGDSIGVTEYVTGTSYSSSIRVISGPCYILEIPTSNTIGVEWAMKINALMREREKNSVSI